MIDIFGKKNKESNEILKNLPLAYVKFRIDYDSEGKPADLIFLDANDHLIKIAGRPFEDLIGKKITEVSPEIESTLSNRFAADYDKIAKGSVYELELFIEARKKWYDVHVNIPDRDTAIVLLSDCTRRKQLELELSVREKKFKSFYLESPIGIYTATPEGNLIDANPSLLKTLEFSSFEELSENNPFFNGSVSGKKSDTGFVRKKNNGSISSHEFRWVSKSGRAIHLRESARAIHDNNGKPLYIESTVEDVTERKTAESQIAKLTELYIEIGVDQHKNIGIILQKACEIINGSCSFYNILDEEKNLLITFSKHNAPHGIDQQDDPAGHICYEATIKGQNKPVIIEDLFLSSFVKTDKNISKYGWRFYLGMPVILNEKTIGSICVIGPEPKKFTATEISIIGTLAKVLALEYQRLLIQDDFLKATNEAKNANQAKSQFLANMSHEIRTPLNGIIGFAEMLSSQEPDERKARILNMIEDSGYQLLQIINDIFNYSRLETSKISLKTESFALDAVIGDVVSFFQKTIRDKNLQFIVNTDKIEEKSLEGDFYKLKQVLINVISNAIKFTEEGSVIFIAESARKENYIEVKLTIEDTGIGINQEHLDRIFDDFKQLEFYLTKKIKGTGLGLSITKKLIDLMNGEIEVESEQGKGSRFIITIPFKTATQAANKNKEEYMDKSKSNLSSAGKKVKILLAEDNEANQFLIKAITKSQDWDITVVENGIQAVEKYKSGRYDIILMDVQMPEMNGYEATKVIRQIESEKGIHTPIIALTAYAMKTDKDLCIEAGMDNYISKPFKRQQFLDSINEIISGK